MQHVQTGLDRIVAGDLPALRGRRIGLVTNPNGTDRAFRSSVSLLARSDHCRVVSLFGPEHGIRGSAQAGARVEGEPDPETGLPIFSLYGETRRPTAEMLSGLDAMVIDLQDLGVRFTTYFSTVVEALHAAQEHHIEVIILDRPNPLGGKMVRGNLLDPAFSSFVGAHPLPIIHGLTLGEIALLVARDRVWSRPTVITMKGWTRDLWFDETDLPWIQPSPNLPTLDGLTLYSGTCFTEGTSLSEGRGTTRPFEFVGAPGIDPERLGQNLRDRQLPGVAFRPAYFMPMFSKHEGSICGGVQVYCTDRDALDTPVLGIHLLDAYRALDPDFAWITGSSGKAFIDLLLGSDRPRLGLEAGASPAEIVADWVEDCRTFRSSREDILLYH